RYVFRYG
ncbi:Triosephosphate isomerase, partial [Haemophilus influenzae]